MVKTILAIDPGSKFLGLYDGAMGVTIDASMYKDPVERVAAAGVTLAEILNDSGPIDFIVYEEQFVRGGPATKALMKITGIIEFLGRAISNAGIISVPQSTLRKFTLAELGLPPKRLTSSEAKEAMKQFAISKDPKLATTPGVTEHVFDAAALYYFVALKGEIN